MFIIGRKNSNSNLYEFAYFLLKIILFINRKKRAVDRNIPEKVRIFYNSINSCFFFKGNLERRLDATIMRKRLEIQEIISRPMKVIRYYVYALLLSVFNRIEN